MEAKKDFSEININFLQLVENSRDGIVLLKKRKIVYTNSSWLNITGHKGDDVIGKSFVDFLNISSQKTFLEEIEKLEEGSSNETKFESAILKPENENLDIYITLIKIGSSTEEYIALYLHDISDLKKMETRSRQTQNLESIGTLAAGIAHEINTPTQYVGDNISFLSEAFQDFQDLFHEYENLLHSEKLEKSGIEEEIENIEEKREYIDIEFICEEIPRALEQSQEGIAQVTQIVRAMRDFAHPIQDEMVPTDFNKLVRNTVIVAKNEWKYHSTIQYELDDSLPMIICNPGEIGQVLLNLLINSAHSVAEKREVEQGDFGIITLATNQDENTLYFKISDTGNGIPDDIKEKVFNPFFTTKEVGKGTGQGLAIAFRVIVESHHGSINFDSNAGEGTTFNISLPFNCSETANE